MAKKPPTPPLPFFARRLAELRQATGLTVYALARRAGVNASNLYNLEAGRRNPSLDVMRKLAVALGKTLNDFEPGGQP